MLGQLLRGIGYRDKKVFIVLFIAYVRPILEYCSSAWSPWTAGDKAVVEAVQKRAVKVIVTLLKISKLINLTMPGWFIGPLGVL